LIYDETQSISKEKNEEIFEIPPLSSSSQPPLKRNDEIFFPFYIPSLPISYVRNILLFFIILNQIMEKF
jgi:hypothetical protein